MSIPSSLFIDPAVEKSAGTCCLEAQCTTSGANPEFSTDYPGLTGSTKITTGKRSCVGIMKAGTGIHTGMWLVSPASVHVAGIVVPVDGGFSAYRGV